MTLWRVSFYHNLVRYRHQASDLRYQASDLVRGALFINKQASVAVAQEAEVMVESIVIKTSPVVLAHKGGNEQQQC